MSKRLRVVGVVVGAALIACAVWIARTRPNASRSQVSTTRVAALPAHLAGSSQQPAAANLLPAAAQVAPPIASADSSAPGDRALAAAKLDETARFYRDTMTFPLWSRPADGSNQHITNWNRAISTDQTFAEDAAKQEIRARAELDRVFVGPGQAITVQVSASYVATGAPAPVDQVEAELQARAPGGEDWFAVQPMPLTVQGSGWTSSIIPSRISALRDALRETRILIFIKVGEFSRELTLDFRYAAGVPVIIKGIRAERVVEGSLELDLGVDLKQVATVALQATLFAADGQTAIAVFDDRFFPTQAGAQVFTARFFGKILHDRGIDGPYVLGAVHGYVYLRDQEPDQLFFEHPAEPKLVTAPHRASEFSADAFDSPELAARLAHYQAVRDALLAGRPPPPPPPSFYPPAPTSP